MGESKVKYKNLDVANDYESMKHQNRYYACDIIGIKYVW